MNEFEADCLQRKKLAQQYRYKKNGSKSKKCFLPSDHLTRKEWKEKCGEMITCKLNEPIGWKEFKKLSKESKEEYIKGLQEEYSATCTVISEMMGITPITLRRHISDNNLNIHFRVGTTMNDRQKERWEMFLKGEMPNPHGHGEEVRDTEAIKEPEVIQDNSDYDTNVARGKSEMRTSMDYVNIAFSGKIEVSSVVNSIKNILGESCYGSLVINYESSDSNVD